MDPMEQAICRPTLSPTSDRKGDLVGCRYLGPSGYIWTVRSITAAGQRVCLGRPTPDGDAGIVVDWEALNRMIPVPAEDGGVEQGQSNQAFAERRPSMVV